VSSTSDGLSRRPQPRHHVNLKKHEPQQRTTRSEFPGRRFFHAFDPGALLLWRCSAGEQIEAVFCAGRFLYFWIRKQSSATTFSPHGRSIDKDAARSGLFPLLRPARLVYHEESEGGGLVTCGVDGRAKSHLPKKIDRCLPEVQSLSGARRGDSDLLKHRVLWTSLKNAGGTVQSSTRLRGLCGAGDPACVTRNHVTDGNHSSDWFTHSAQAEQRTWATFPSPPTRLRTREWEAVSR
jgi:hypothetical protein